LSPGLSVIRWLQLLEVSDDEDGDDADAVVVVAAAEILALAAPPKFIAGRR